MDTLPPDRWYAVDRIFTEALDLRDGERAVFVRQACGSDDALYDEVIALLQSREAAQAALGESATAFAALLLPDLQHHLDDAARLPSGTRIGPYRLLEEIGRGGMGTVYLAERIDAYHRRVALKLVKRGMDSDEILRRFRYERQILAGLEHPHIARLYDGGLSDDGRPYLAMEYVDGRPIDQYCDAATLDIDARLRLFASVCEAVQYAHQNLVVHRDLKPSNVLITAAGQVKLLDFGIAKLLDEEAAGVSAPVTRTGLRVMTPAYAAPEQVRGEAITTATHVYALGVVLYKLLTGQRPYEDVEENAQAAERAVLEQEPVRPSTAITKATETLTPERASAARATSVERLQRRLQGDLDVMVLKALRKEPERRYASAAAFAEDIRRHLDGLPVTARPDTRSYRVRKFVRRHRFGVGTAAVFALLVSAFTLLYAVQVTQERNLAQQERAKAEQVVTLFTDLFKAADPKEAGGDTLNVYQLMDQSRQRIETALAAQPDVQAKMWSVLGGVYFNMGQYDQAVHFQEQALALRRALYGNGHRDVAESMMLLGDPLRETAAYDRADSLLREALALQRTIHGDAHIDIVRTLNGLALTIESKGAFDEAEQLLREAVALRRRVQEEAPPDEATLLQNLGEVLREKGDYDNAQSVLLEALTLQKKSEANHTPRSP